uniref:Putative secreted protein n=1 Tax=Anopheles triannulatus TaxID=58253 RepID=A0A2M4B2K4_9DIPT
MWLLPPRWLLIQALLLYNHPRSPTATYTTIKATLRSSTRRMMICKRLADPWCTAIVTRENRGSTTYAKGCCT